MHCIQRKIVPYNIFDQLKVQGICLIMFIFMIKQVVDFFSAQTIKLRDIEILKKE